MRAPVLSSMVLLAAMLAGAPARAQEDATLTTIRALGEEGEALFERGAYADALDRFVRVDALLKRHTIGVYIGRCLEKLGRLNEAAERYLAVIRMGSRPLSAPVNAAKLKLQQEARAAAEGLRATLLPRIPAVILQVDAPPDVRVSIDGQPVSAALFGVKHSINPGAHTVEARAGGAVVKRDLSVQEAEVLTVPITLHPAAPVVPPPAASPPATLPDAPPVTSPRDAAVDPSVGARRTAGFVGIGVGVAGVGVGALAGALAWAKRGDLERSCGGDLRCHAPPLEDLVNRYNAQRTASTVGFIVGGVALAAGVVLVVTAPAPRRAATVSLFAGLDRAGVKGAF